MKKKNLTKEEIKKVAAKGHGMPVTRRQFLAHGLVEGLGFMAMPSLLDSILRPGFAYGEECPAAATGGAINQWPLLVIDMSGGPIQNNFLPLDIGGVPLASYDRLGMPDPTQFVSTYGLPFRNGPMLTAMEAVLDAAGRARTRASAIAVQSADDSNQNRSNPMSLLKMLNVAANAPKPLSFGNGLGSRTSASGGNSQPALAGDGQPFASANVTNVLAAVTPAFAGLSTAQRSVYLNFVSGLTGSQLANFSGMTSAAQLQTALKCGVKRVVDNAGSAASIDFRTDTVVQTVFGITAATNDANARDAELVALALEGHTLGATIERGGGDNHGQGQATMDTYHAGVGTLMGKALQLANLKNKNLMIVLIADGGQSSQQGATSGSSDAGDKGLVSIIVHRASGAPTLINNGMAGFFNAAQSASTTSYVGGNPTRAAYAAIFTLANLMGGGTLGRLANMVDRQVIDTSKISEMITLG